MHQETFIAKLTDIQRTVEQLLTQLQASEQGAQCPFASASQRTVKVPEKK